MDVIGTLALDGYSFIHIPHSYGAGGGVGVLFKKTLKLVKTTFLPAFRTFEQLECTISLGNSCLHLVVVYRPPSRVNGFTVKDFFIGCHLEMVNCFYWVILTFTLRTRLAVTLLHLEIFLTTAVWLFILVKPSHFAGHCLDVIVTRKDDNIIQSIATNNPAISTSTFCTKNLNH